MRELEAGLYEVLVTEALQARLQSVQSGSGRSAMMRPLRAVEAADRIALHLSRQIAQALDGVADANRVQIGIEVARALIDRLAEMVDADTTDAPLASADVLHAILGRRPDGRPREISEPLIPLLDTTLLTNAPGEPRLVSQLQAEIESADAIDVVMAFIRGSGIAPLLEDLRRHCAEHLLSLGATDHQGPVERGPGFVTASVIDPFGNILGVMYNQHYLDTLSDRAAPTGHA